MPSKTQYLNAGKYNFGKVSLEPMLPAVSPLKGCDPQGGPQGIYRALVLHRTTCAVLLADLCGSFAVCVSKSTPPSLLVCWFLDNYWSGKLPFSVTVPVSGRFLGWFPLSGLPWIPPFSSWLVAPCKPFRYMYQFPSSSICDEFTPFAVHLQKISIHLCSNLFHYG